MHGTVLDVYRRLFFNLNSIEFRSAFFAALRKKKFKQTSTRLGDATNDLNHQESCDCLGENDRCAKDQRILRSDEVVQLKPLVDIGTQRSMVRSSRMQRLAQLIFVSHPFEKRTVAARLIHAQDI